MRTLPNEPVLSAATISGVISSALVMLVALGIINLDDTQMVAIGGFVALVAPILISLWPRSQVTPTRDPQIRTENGRLVDLVRDDIGRKP